MSSTSIVSSVSLAPRWRTSPAETDRNALNPFPGSLVASTVSCSSCAAAREVNQVQERLEPGGRIDQYQILEHLAEGAQANVYRARDLRSGEVVALKLPHARVLDNAVFVARWRREAQLTETLRHPNIERRTDLG